jgi:uncharacterized protein YbaA (DUF1428 family)
MPAAHSNMKIFAKLSICCRVDRRLCRTGQRRFLCPASDDFAQEAAMNYVDGFVVAVKAENREVYRKHAETAAGVFKEYGALNVVECWGDDVPEGKLTSFPLAVKREPDEVVVFSWVVWPSRAKRDEGMGKVMADPRLQPDVMTMPFDGKRLIYGGFEVIVDV